MICLVKESCLASLMNSQSSFRIARVFNNKYHCFKYCINQKIMPLGPLALNASKYQLTSDLSEDYSKMGSEMQYKYIPPAIIIEEDVISSGKTSTDVTYWWVSNGHPVFVSEQCKSRVKKLIGDIRFGLLGHAFSTQQGRNSARVQSL